jgi:hypothetical protein
LEELLLMSSYPLTSSWELLGESLLCWSSCSASKLLRERVARQVVSGRGVPYVNPTIDKALGESLRESLLVELLALNRSSSHSASCWRSAPYIEPPSDKALGELMREPLLCWSSCSASKLLGANRPVTKLVGSC